MKIGSRLLLAEDKKKLGFKKVNLKLILPVGEAKNNSILGPLLGQHQINIISFCNEFNSKSVLKYVNGVNLPLRVFLKKDKTYDLRLGYPNLSFFLDQVVELNDNQKIFSMLDFYDVIKIFSFYTKKDKKSILILVLGYLTSGRKKYNYKFLK